MKIYLTSPNGFIGRNLRAILEKAGHNVDTNFSWHNCNYDVIINTIGETENEENMFNANVQLSLDWARECFKRKIRFIHLGSILEDVDFRKSKDRVYMATKAAATTLIQSYGNNSGSPWVVLRLSTVYGNDDKNSAFLPTLWDCYANSKVFNLVDAERDWLHIDDACNAILTLVNEPAAIGIFTAGSGGYIWNRDLVKLFIKHVKAEIQVNSVAIEWTGWKANNNALFRLGWHPKVTLDEGIKRFVDSKFFDGQAFLGAEA